jgi:hypothetical protein
VLPSTPVFFHDLTTQTSALPTGCQPSGARALLSFEVLSLLPVPKQPTPTVFQADEGDRWMLLGKKPLIFKVDPVTAGSDTLMVGTG